MNEKVIEVLKGLGMIALIIGGGGLFFWLANGFGISPLGAIIMLVAGIAVLGCIFIGDASSQP